MGAYNFKPQFEDPIMADLKRHTIRAKRKDGRRPKPGEVLSLYVGMRRKGLCRLLKRRHCVKVQEIEIHWYPGFWIVIDCEKLSRDENENLARSDGFSSFAKMMKFWQDENNLPFTGLLIHWESDAEHANHPIPDPKPKRPVGIRRANTRRARR